MPSRACWIYETDGVDASHILEQKTGRVPLVEEISDPDILGADDVETTQCTPFTAVNVLEDIITEPEETLFNTVVDNGVNVLPVMLTVPLLAFLIHSVTVPDVIVLESM